METHESPAEGQNTHEEMSALPALPTTSPRSSAVVGAGLLILIAVVAVAAISYLFRPTGDETTTDSGLKYVDEVVGTGRSVETGDMLIVHYTGYLEDGTVFDSSVERGRPFPPFFLGIGSVIPGWDEGLLGMRVGGKRTLVIPPDLAYGETGTGNGVIPPNATLEFEVELLGIVNVETEDLILGEGPEIGPGNVVVIDFSFRLEDGLEIDSSANSGPAQLQVGNSGIPGVDAGVVGLQVGGKRLITIPPEYAFGEQGVPDQNGGFLIPPGAVIVFEIDLIEILQ